MDSLEQTAKRGYDAFPNDTPLSKGKIILPGAFSHYWAYSARFTFERRNQQNGPGDYQTSRSARNAAINSIISQIRGGVEVHPMGPFASPSLYPLITGYSADPNSVESNEKRPVIPAKRMIGGSGVSFSGMVQDDKFLFEAKHKREGNYHLIYVESLVRIAQQHNAQLAIFGSTSHGISMRYI